MNIHTELHKYIIDYESYTMNIKIVCSILLLSSMNAITSDAQTQLAKIQEVNARLCSQVDQLKQQEAREAKERARQERRLNKERTVGLRRRNNNGTAAQTSGMRSEQRPESDTTTPREIELHLRQQLCQEDQLLWL